MKICVQGTLVKSRPLANFLTNTVIATGDILGRPVELILGFSQLKWDQASCGIFLYRHGRLIEAYKRVGGMIHSADVGGGVIGVMDVTNLMDGQDGRVWVHNNKQGFQDCEAYACLEQWLAKKADEYWDNNFDSLTLDKDNCVYKPDCEWVQCDKCRNWRMLPPTFDSRGLTTQWFCYMAPFKGQCADAEQKVKPGIVTVSTIYLRVKRYYPCRYLKGASCFAMHEKLSKRKNPWIRENICEEEGELNPDYYTPEHMHYVTHLSSKRPKFEVKDDNAFLDTNTKKAVLKISSSIVALISYTGEQELSQCSGVIIENDGNNGHIILTSANLIRRPTKEDMMDDRLADSLKVIIYLYDGQSYDGEVRAYDFHYNLAWIRFQSDSSVATARLRQVDDYLNVNPTEEKLFYLRPHSSHFHLVPGHEMIAVGRYFAKPFDLMAAAGESSLGRCHFDCKELIMGTCKITRCGDGGALINLSGEVIGIIFYYENGLATPFLPINIAHKCWEHYKRYGVLRRPSLGVVATNFYAADISLIEKIIQKFPNICNGFFVEKVIQGSSADAAGLRLNDVIIQCDGKTVHSFLEFVEMVWDKKVGDILDLYVVRAYENDRIHINMVVEEVAAEDFNRWLRIKL